LRFLQLLRDQATWETHLVLSPAAILTAQMELDQKRDVFEALADKVYSHKDIGATIASGSFLTEGMVIIPCSMNSLAAVAHGLSHNLVTRAADVTLKERRRLVLVTRETPLNLMHLRNMTAVTEAGGIIFPPVPSFYFGQLDFDEYITQICGRILDLFGISAANMKRWDGTR
jgi:4-hydroxy-3-polyprenylbenzoate decarboxylase/2,5-furandicarboxylate decarboxylase 2